MLEMAVEGCNGSKKSLDDLDLLDSCNECDSQEYTLKQASASALRISQIIGAQAEVGSFWVLNCCGCCHIKLARSFKIPGYTKQQQNDTLWCRARDSHQCKWSTHGVLEPSYSRGALWKRRRDQGRKRDAGLTRPPFQDTESGITTWVFLQPVLEFERPYPPHLDGRRVFCLDLVFVFIGRP